MTSTATQHHSPGCLEPSGSKPSAQPMHASRHTMTTRPGNPHHRCHAHAAQSPASQPRARQKAGALLWRGASTGDCSRPSQLGLLACLATLRPLGLSASALPVLCQDCRGSGNGPSCPTGARTPPWLRSGARGSAGVLSRGVWATCCSMSLEARYRLSKFPVMDRCAWPAFGGQDDLIGPGDKPHDGMLRASVSSLVCAEGWQSYCAPCSSC